MKVRFLNLERELMWFDKGQAKMLARLEELTLPYSDPLVDLELLPLELYWTRRQRFVICPVGEGLGREVSSGTALGLLWEGEAQKRLTAEGWKALSALEEWREG